MNTQALLSELDQPYLLDARHIDFYREHGYIKLKQVFSPETLAEFGALITRKVIELSTESRPLDQRDTYSKAFLQIGNLWRHDEGVKDFVFSPRLARIATELMEVDGVRLYHDQALYKEASGGYTPWHVDQAYWPLATDRTVTAWIPLQETPLEMGALCFAAESQRFENYRDLRISEESERLIDAAMRDGSYRYVEEPFALGEVSFHSGWTFHRAGPNRSADPRRVMTIIYMDRDMRIADSEAKANDWATWCDSIPEGEVCAGPLNPVLWSGGC